jgi:FAD-NAD(P)-binding
VLRIAIVGAGPWGLCALERVVTLAREDLPRGVDVAVHVVEPGTPGSGVYDITQPDYLLLNNPCGQLTLYPFETESYQPSYGVSQYDWVVARGYRWVGDRCAMDPAGEPIEPYHFLPRRLMGEYLQWFYRALLASAPANVQIVRHQTSAVDLVATRGGCEEVRLADGSAVVMDHVIVTTGHTPNQDVDGSRAIRPYPITSYVDQIPAGTKVAVSGMGLVAVDVVTALTIGRGGTFAPDGGGLRYRPSGREPELGLYNRSGLPFTAKPVTGSERVTVYEPLICTPEAVDALTGRTSGRRRQVDVRRELLPLLFPEMYARYYAQMAFQAEGSRAAGAAVRERLRAAWLEDRFRDELARLASVLGSFDAESLLFGDQPSYHSSDDYERFVYQSLADNLRAADLQSEPPARGRPARPALPPDARADGRRRRPDAIRLRPGADVVAGFGRPWRGSDPSLLNRLRPAVRRRRRPRDPWPSRGAAHRQLGLGAAEKPLPRARQPVPLRRGRRGQRQHDG